MPLKAVIFDMDGVILDSMRYHVQAWQKTFKPLGLNISSYEIYKREGESWKKSTRDFLKMAGYTPKHKLANDVFKIRSNIFREIFRPKVFKGAKGFLIAIKKKNLKLALVTATPRDDLKRMLSRDIVELFDVMVCGGDTKKGKPHPEPYLKALKKLKIKKKEAIVIENAPYGIKSAKLAGIKCIAIATSLPKEYLKEADVVFDSLNVHAIMPRII